MLRPFTRLGRRHIVPESIQPAFAFHFFLILGGATSCEMSPFLDHFIGKAGLPSAIVWFEISLPGSIHHEWILPMESENGVKHY